MRALSRCFEPRNFFRSDLVKRRVGKEPEQRTTVYSMTRMSPLLGHERRWRAQAPWQNSLLNTACLYRQNAIE